MFGFKSKKLNRNDFIKLVDSNKIWSKSMTLAEIKNLLEYLENEISKHDFDIDKNFIMNSRRKEIKAKIEERTLQNDRDINKLVSESLFNFWEFVSDEYPGGAGGIMLDCRELGLSIKEFDAMDNAYRKKGIICSQEKEVMLEMIQVIKKYINKNLKIDNNPVISFGNGCVVSKKIFEENYKIGYMKRDFPSGEYPDSGWRFFVGNEDETYTNDSNNMQIYSLESMIEHDSDIEKYLNSPNESEFIRINDHCFVKDDGNQKIYITKKENIK